MTFLLLFPFHIILLSLLIIKSTAIVDILNYANMSSPSIANVSTTLLANNGQSSYVSLQNGSNFIVNKYNINLTTGIPTYVNKYVDPYNRFNSNRLLIYNNSYLITLSTTNMIFNAFGLTSFSFYGNYTIGQYVEQFYHVTSKAIVLYITTNGKLGYVLDNQFPNGNYKYLIDQNFSATSKLTIAVSNDQNYVALGSNMNSSIFVYYLTNYTLKCNYNLPTSGTSALTWMTNNQTVLISSITQGYMIQLNITACTGIQQTVTAVQTYQVVKMTYYSITNQAIFTGLSISTPYNYAIYSFSLNTNSITCLKNYSSNSSLVSYEYQPDNNNYFGLSQLSSINYMEFVISCSSGLIYDLSIYQCVQNITTPTSNSTNSTSNTTNSTSNTTNQTSNATNTTQSINASSITNTNTTNSSTINNSTNTSNTTAESNNTNLINTTNQTNTSSNTSNNSLNSLNYTQTYENSQVANFQSFVKGSLKNQFISALNSVPGSRKFLQPLFTFFVNFDDLWLYNYHEREYDIVITSVFDSVQQIQNQKWTLLQFQKIWYFIGLDSNDTIQLFSSKYNQSSWRFIQVQQNSNGFVLNTLNFFCSNVFFIFIIFIAFRIVFFLLFKYRVSIIFREYAFWIYFIMVILDGNVQYLTYLFSFQMENFFSVNFSNKFGLGFAVILYFVIFIFAVAAFPIVKNQYGHLLRYFTQNLRVCEVSFIYMSFQLGYRNIILGFLHTMFDENYTLKILSLISTEIVFLIFIIALIKKDIFINHLKVWVNIIATLLRILIIFTFYLDYHDIETDIQYVHMAIFYVYISEMFLAMSIQMIRILLQTISFIRGNQTIEEYIRAVEKINKKSFQNSHRTKRYMIKFVQKKASQLKEDQIKQIPYQESNQTINYQDVRVDTRIYKSKIFKKINQNSMNSSNNSKSRQEKYSMNSSNNSKGIQKNNLHLKTRAPIMKIKKNMKIFQYVPGMTLESQTNISQILQIR